MTERSGGSLLTEWAHRGLAALGAARAEIDALNVYPVPDGDTGTNLYLTLEAACAAWTRPSRRSRPRGGTRGGRRTRSPAARCSAPAATPASS